MTVGVDRAGALSPGDMHRLRAAYGVSWLGVYIGGSCSAGVGWSGTLIQTLGQLGFGFLPTYVGPQAKDVCGDDELTAERGAIDGEDAARIVSAYGFAGIHAAPCALDIEANTFSERPKDALAYAAAWSERVSENRLAPILYSSKAMIEVAALQETFFEGFWLADWTVNGPHIELGVFDVQVSEQVLARFPYRAWQYSGSAKVPELDAPCDWSVADFPMASTVSAISNDIHVPASNPISGGDEMTDAQLAEIVGAIKGAATSQMIWLARQQRGLDVVTGKTLDTSTPSTDPRVAGGGTGNVNG